MTLISRRATLRFGLCASAIATAPAIVTAQEAFPSKPFRVVVPYTAGGVSDTVTRMLMQKLAERLNTTVTVESIPGANGQVGSAVVARAAPDGYTMVVVVAGHSINPSLYPKMTYSPLQDLSGVSLIGHIPLLMVSSAQLPPTTLKEFITWVKANPAKANYGSSGAGSAAHMVSALFAQTVDAPMVHVPYKGGAAVVPDLLSGQVAMLIDSVQTLMPHVKAGKLRALAMTSAKRWPAALDVPTMVESGYPTMTTGSWLGILAPSKTPKDMLARLAAEFDKIIQTPDAQARLIAAGIDPVGGTAPDFDRFIHSEAARWADVVKRNDIKLD